MREALPSTKPTIEIVAHCWRYPKILCYHLSALLDYPPTDFHVISTIFHAPREFDPATFAMLHWFRFERPRPHLTFNFRQLSVPRLCRRAIGRNIACKQSSAGCLWLADLDYLVGPHSLDYIVNGLARARGPLVYPLHCRRNLTDAAGDSIIQRVSVPGHMSYCPSEFPVNERNPRAIGGIQVVSGDTARKFGYLPDHPKWQTPAEVWQKTGEDPAYRTSLGVDSGEPIDVPNLYRLRHSVKGRDDANCEN